MNLVENNTLSRVVPHSIWQCCCIIKSRLVPSETTLVSVWNTRVIWTALTALVKPRTCWPRIRGDPSPKRRIALHTSLASANIPCLVFFQRVALYITLPTPASGFLYFPSGMWWSIRTLRTTRMFHTSHGLQLFSSRLDNAWRCLCLSSANSHMPHSHVCFALRICHILQYSLRFGYIACHCICFAIIVF
jgi:hypothetical protein